jgi:hypothetical protein
MTKKISPPLAFPARAVETNLMPGGFKTGGIAQLFGERIFDWNSEVYDRSTLLTDEMVMGGRLRLESVEGAAKIDSADQALRNKDPEVAVHSSHTEVRELFSKLVIYPIGGRMAFYLSEDVKDAISLPASSSLWRHDGKPRSMLSHNRNHYRLCRPVLCMSIGCYLGLGEPVEHSTHFRGGMTTGLEKSGHFRRRMFGGVFILRIPAWP